MAVGVAGDVEDVPAVDSLSRLDRVHVTREVDVLAQAGALVPQLLGLGLRQPVPQEVGGDAPGRTGIAPHCERLLVVEPALEHGRPRQRRDVGCAPDVIRVQMGDEDALDRAVERGQDRRPERLGITRPEARVDERPASVGGAKQVAVDVVDSERERERDAAYAVEQLVHRGI